MGDEKFNYYIPFLFVTHDGDLGVGHTFTERRSAIETADDVKSLHEELNKQEGLRAKMVTALDWKRIQ